MKKGQELLKGGAMTSISSDGSGNVTTVHQQSLSQLDACLMPRASSDRLLVVTGSRCEQASWDGEGAVE